MKKNTQMWTDFIFADVERKTKNCPVEFIIIYLHIQRFCVCKTKPGIYSFTYLYFEIKGKLCQILQKRIRFIIVTLQSVAPWLQSCLSLRPAQLRPY